MIKEMKETQSPPLRRDRVTVDENGVRGARRVRDTRARDRGAGGNGKLWVLGDRKFSQNLHHEFLEQMKNVGGNPLYRREKHLGR